MSQSLQITKDTLVSDILHEYGDIADMMALDEFLPMVQKAAGQTVDEVAS